MYYNTEEYGKARSFLEKSLQITKEVGDKYARATMLTNLGKLYFELGKSKEALNIVIEAFRIAQEIGDESIKAQNLIFLGVINNILYGENTEPMILEAIQTIERLNEYELLATGYFFLSQVRKNMTRLKEAKTALKKARGIAQKYGLSKLSEKIQKECSKMK